MSCSPVLRWQGLEGPGGWNDHAKGRRGQRAPPEGRGHGSSAAGAKVTVQMDHTETERWRTGRGGVGVGGKRIRDGWGHWSRFRRRPAVGVGAPAPLTRLFTAEGRCKQEPRGARAVWRAPTSQPAAGSAATQRVRGTGRGRAGPEPPSRAPPRGRSCSCSGGGATAPRTPCPHLASRPSPAVGLPGPAQRSHGPNSNAKFLERDEH